jgi:hypothetical protein
MERSQTPTKANRGGLAAKEWAQTRKSPASAMWEINREEKFKCKRDRWARTAKR